MTETSSNQGVYFLSLSVENVRCFAEKQTLDLSDGSGRPAQWTVILGDNGVGKTTLLEVLANLMLRGDETHDWPRKNAQTFKVNYQLVFDSQINNSDRAFQRQEITVDLNLYEGRAPENTRIYPYSASRRPLKNSAVRLRDTRSDIPDSPEELINAEEWLLQIDYIVNRASDPSIEHKYKQRFTLIRETLIDLLPDLKDIRISEPSETIPKPRVEFRTLDGWISLHKMSLGYQTMVAWMVDLAARLFDEYPNSPNPIVEPAVVLIDEIDLHLHPKWQRTIMAYLSERFVNTQFIVTAHSPLIVQAAENANIVVLKREGDSVKIHQHPQDVKGWRIDQLLTSDLFDLPSARSPHYENLLNQRRQILSQAQLTDTDQAKLSELECQIGELPTAETPEDIDAMNIIRRAAELLK
ncbi:AAA family ATPase [Methylomonas sp. TEB]|uniref:AAA family ATPase n=1 Tax=Methylomonas sp. TEB TaxID=3398229 RepID=UPI0039F4C3A9